MALVNSQSARGRRGPREPEGFTSDEPLYLTADRSEAVKKGDPRATFILCRAGGTVPAREAERLGLTSPESAGTATATEKGDGGAEDGSGSSPASAPKPKAARRKA